MVLRSKRRVGRPKGNYSKRYQLPYNPKQMKLWLEASFNDGRALPAWIRKTLDDAAQKQLEASPLLRKQIDRAPRR